MILALLLAAQQAAPAPPAEEAEIVVLARKMRLIKVDLKAPRRNGKMVLKACRVTRSSGIPELDVIPCDAAQACIAEEPKTGRELERCVEAKARVRLDAVVAARRARS